MKRLFVWLFGAPLCGGCQAYYVDCIGWCKKTEKERIDAYLNS